jgi:predicted RNA-binding protein YlxR (DUF448 family)/ribosomal protein L30E
MARRELPERRCLVTREVKDRDRMIRFVLDPAGQVVPDVDGRLPGRGMWLSADRNVLNRAIAANLFARAARMRVQVRADMAEQVERLLASRALDCLGLARRAGQVAMGFDQVRAFLRSSSAAVLIAAADSAADGRRKLRQLAPGVPVITAFSKAELGAALGREGIVHAAVAPGGLARRLIGSVRRLAGFRAGAMAPAAAGTSGWSELEDTTERP